MLPLLLLLFIAVPILELYVILQVGQAIGAVWTIALLVASSIAGSLLLRSQGRAVWRRFNEALAARRAPAREVVDGVLVIFGGALLLTPGFCSDVLGALFLLPFSRAAVRRLLLGLVGRRILVATPAGAFGPAAYGTATRVRRARRRRARPAPADVEGTAHEVADDPGRLAP
jgi:UPF0716 protein FxsA